MPFTSPGEVLKHIPYAIGTYGKEGVGAAVLESSNFIGEDR